MDQSQGRTHSGRLRIARHHGRGSTVDETRCSLHADSIGSIAKHNRIPGRGIVKQFTDKDKDELIAQLKCPFCGGGPIAESRLVEGRTEGELDAFQYWIRCRSCAGQGGWSKSPSGALANWRMRPWAYVCPGLPEGSD